MSDITVVRDLLYDRINSTTPGQAALVIVTMIAVLYDAAPQHAKDRIDILMWNPDHDAIRDTHNE